MNGHMKIQANSKSAPVLSPAGSTLLQRKCACGGTPGPTGECAECRRKRLLAGTPLQAQLNVSRPDDKYEREADQIAEEIMQMAEPRLQRQVADEADDQLVRPSLLCEQAGPYSCNDRGCSQFGKSCEPVEPGTMRGCKCARTTIPASSISQLEEETVQTQPASGHTPAAAEPISVAQSGGQPLPRNIRALFEPRFGHDFSKVRVHSDSKGAESARAVDALAYTVGNNIVFSAGQYAPSTANGQKLIAHELTHVIQQSTMSSNKLFRREQIAGGSAASTQQQEPPSCGCTPPPASSCRRISSGSDTREDVVRQAFQTAANWLPAAQAALQEYVDAPAGERANKAAAAPLRAHFNWPPSGRGPLRDTPPMVLGVINRLFDHFAQPVCANCQDECPCTGDDDPWACVPGAWENSNCVEFCEPFFANPSMQPHVVLHEMMHAWEAKGDISYENDGPPSYPPNALMAQSNADSYAALIRDLGQQSGP